MQVKMKELELDMEKQTGSKLGKEYIKAIYCHSAYLTYMQSTYMWNARLDDSEVGIKIYRRNVNNFKYADNTTLMAKTDEEMKSLLVRVKERVKKLA